MLILYIFKEEDFDYDEGVYADLNLDNFVEPDMENESEAESEAEPEGIARHSSQTFAATYCQSSDLPPQTPMKKKKHDEDEPAKDEVRDTR